MKENAHLDHEVETITVGAGRARIALALERIRLDLRRSRKSVRWQERRAPPECDHQHEVIAHDNGASVSACTRCGALDRDEPPSASET